MFGQWHVYQQKQASAPFKAASSAGTFQRATNHFHMWGVISSDISYLPFVSSQTSLEVKVHFKARGKSGFFQVHRFIFREAEDQGHG